MIQIRQILKYQGFVFIVWIGLVSCKNQANSDQRLATDGQPKPNILWLVTEDMGQYIPPFGDSTIQTPNLSRLAREGVIYTNLYSPSGVCAPSRAAIATGMYPSGIGANHMRTNSHVEERGMPAYEAVPPAEVKMISELLRLEGYYCTNNYKTDYQFKAPVTAWDESSPYAHWRNRDEGQPFFSVFNFTETHESGLFEPYGHRKIETRHYHAGDTTYKWGEGRLSEDQINIHLPRDTKFNIPPYLPVTKVVQRDMWKMYNNIAEMDQQVGFVLDQLEADGLLENTIIFFYGDHGGPLPRQKRLIYESGLKTPLIIRLPDGQNPGKTDDRLLSFVDFAPTLLSIAGIEPPGYLQGQAFLGSYQTKSERKYIHAAADRFDAITDVIRAVKNDRYKYIRNYRPEQGYYLPIEYREQIPTMKELLRLYEVGELNAVQSQWFRERKPSEELFDCLNDPHELNNLAADPAYAHILIELRKEMDRWLIQIGDEPNLPEDQLITELWNGQEEQPKTENPVFRETGVHVAITSATIGASIGYKRVDQAGESPWMVYHKPLKKLEGVTYKAVAHRIGYKPSKVIHSTL